MTGHYATRVLRGIATMDLHHGAQWVWRVDPDTLSLSSSCECVLGQLYDGLDVEDPYWTGRHAMGISPLEAIDSGFELGWVEHHPKGWAILDRIWVYAIRRLREQRPRAVTS